MSIEFFMQEYMKNAEERQHEGIPPLALNTIQTQQVIEILKGTDDTNKEFCKELLANRINPGVDDSAKLKATFLGDIANNNIKCSVIDRIEATKLLGTMLGGYNVPYLVKLLESSDENVAKEAAKALKHTLLVYDAFDTIATMSKTNTLAKDVVESWANAEWFLSKPKLEEEIKLAVLKIDGETNTDDLSPASDAFTRSDIPLHAKAMLKNRIENYEVRIENVKKIAKENNANVVYVGDVVGTGSSRKSACNSIVWHFGNEIPFVPNKKSGGFVIGSIIAPIFFATCEDSGCLPIVANVDSIKEGDIITLKPYSGQILKNGKEISSFTLNPITIFDEIRAGGRIPLIIGRGLTNKARAFLGLTESSVFSKPEQPKASTKGYTLAQKMVGIACGKDGVRAGEYCEPKATTVGSQDTTGAMTRDEVKELASLRFSSDFVMQSFCHTAAYPKPADVSLQNIGNIQY